MIRGVGKTLQVGDHLLHGHLHEKQRPTIKTSQYLEPSGDLNVQLIRGVVETLQVGDHLLHGHLHEKNDRDHLLHGHLI